MYKVYSHMADRHRMSSDGKSSQGLWPGWLIKDVIK